MVDWPSQSLRSTTLIDTPGIASTSKAVSQRTVASSTPTTTRPTEADAVVYLMRHLHARDAAFLEAFRDRGVARATAVNTVAVLSRADEIGGGRVDAMFSAREHRRRATGPTRRCAGSARTWSPWPGCSRRPAARCGRPSTPRSPRWPRTTRDDLETELLSVDRFLRAGRDSDVTAEVRATAAGAVRAVRDPAVDLADPPGRRQPRRAGDGAGRPQRPARAAAGAAHAVRRAPRPAQGALGAAGGGRVLRSGDGRAPPGPLAREIERILAGAHEFTELRLLGALRSRRGRAPDPGRRRRPSGCSATPARAARPGWASAPDAPGPELRQAAYDGARALAAAHGQPDAGPGDDGRLPGGGAQLRGHPRRAPTR